MIAESGLNDPKVIARRGCDAVWADDFHHALRVLLTGDREGYYAEFGTLAALAKASSARISSTARTRASAAAGSARRPMTSPPSTSSCSPPTTTRSATARSATGCRSRRGRSPPSSSLLAPPTPMLFQGEEHGERAPFRFFSDHIDEEIAVATREGRRREFAAFAEFEGEEVPDPQDQATFAASKVTREGEPEGLRELYGACWGARRAPVGRLRGDRLRRARRLAARPSRPVHAARQLRPGRCPRPGRGTVEIGLTTHHATLEPGFVVLPALSGALIK